MNRFASLAQWKQLPALTRLTGVRFSEGARVTRRSYGGEVPYADPAERNRYARDWVARRRASWFEGKACVRCGAMERLELDHIDPRKKVSHSIWSWTIERRNAELAKCQVLCQPCHKDKMREGHEYASGESNGNAKVTAAQVSEIRGRCAAGESAASVGRDFGIGASAAQRIVRREVWRHV